MFLKKKFWLPESKVAKALFVLVNGFYLESFAEYILYYLLLPSVQPGHRATTFAADLSEVGESSPVLIIHDNAQVKPSVDC